MLDKKIFEYTKEEREDIYKECSSSVYENKNESLLREGETFLDFVLSREDEFTKSEIFKHYIGGVKRFLKYDGNYSK